MAQKSQQELYDLFINELQAQAPELTDVNPGSINDIDGGLVSTAVAEIQALVIEQFKRTFFDTADGPEITGGPDYLEDLAKDHFGSLFKRPTGAKATGTVTFSRANTNAGNVSILAGTVVKTPANAAGTSVRFEVVSSVTLTGLSINASVRAVSVGVDGNVLANEVTQIETTLTDTSVVVTNAAAFAGGDDTLTDSEYREYIRNLIETIRGATLKAIEATALTVAGVEKASAIEFVEVVIKYIISTGLTSGNYFKMVRPKLYIADANGTASLALINDVKAAIKGTRAAGANVEVEAATALTQNWTASITLNPGGPNFATLQTNTQKLKDDMELYIQSLPVGQGFTRATANAYMLGLWGPSGTNDLTAFTTSTPSGDVAGVTGQKLVPGTISIA